MKIVYDISVLGFMHGRPIYGVRRTVEKLAMELAKSAECELFFCASYSLKATSLAMDYLDQHQEFSHVPFLASRLRTQFYRTCDYWVQSLYGHSPSGLAWRFFRRLMSEGLRGINCLVSPLDQKAVKNLDIFYTNFFLSPWATRLSQWVPTRRNGRLKRIINLYHLLPIQKPKFSPELDPSFSRGCLKGIRPEDWVTCCSHAVKNDICTTADWINPGRIRVIYWGASEVFRPAQNQKEIDSIRKKYHIPQGPYLLCFNYPSRHKNTLLAVQAFRTLVEEEHLKDLSLVLAGYPLRQDSEVAHILKNSKESRRWVVFTGFVSDTDLALLYSGALVFIYPSLWEGFGLPPLEAMQCGAPVIASNRTSIPEVVGKAGILIDATRVDELCQAVLKIYRDSEYREKLIAQSLERAKQFSWEKCVRETLDTYRMAINSN